MLEKKMGAKLFDQDIFVNVAQLKHIKHPKLAPVSSIQECWKLLF
jgi:hypothetical protein